MRDNIKYRNINIALALWLLTISLVASMNVHRCQGEVIGLTLQNHCCAEKSTCLVHSDTKEVQVQCCTFDTFETFVYHQTAIEKVNLDLFSFHFLPLDVLLFDWRVATNDQERLSYTNYFPPWLSDDVLLITQAFLL